MKLLNLVVFFTLLWILFILAVHIFEFSFQRFALFLRLLFLLHLRGHHPVDERNAVFEVVLIKHSLQVAFGCDCQQLAGKKGEIGCRLGYLHHFFLLLLIDLLLRRIEGVLL